MAKRLNMRIGTQRGEGRLVLGVGGVYLFDAGGVGPGLVPLGVTRPGCIFAAFASRFEIARFAMV